MPWGCRAQELGGPSARAASQPVGADGVGGGPVYSNPDGSLHPAAFTRCSSRSSPRPTTNGTTGHPRVTASERAFRPWAARAAQARLAEASPGALSGLGQGHRPCPAPHTLCRISQGRGVSAKSPAPSRGLSRCLCPGTPQLSTPGMFPAPCPSSLLSSCTHVFPPSASVVLCPLSLGIPCPVLLSGRSHLSPLWARSACSSHTRLCSTPVSYHSPGAAGRGWAPVTFLLGTAGHGPRGIGHKWPRGGWAAAPSSPAVGSRQPGLSLPRPQLLPPPLLGGAHPGGHADAHPGHRAVAGASAGPRRCHGAGRPPGEAGCSRAGRR